MYFYLLMAHSLVRWAVIALGLLAAFSLLRPGGAGGRRVVPFVIALDLQLILGAALWLWLSPLSSAHGGVLADPETRHFTVAHPGVGITAVLLGHTGNVFLKKGFAQARLLIFLAVASALVAVPWGRPLFRL